LKNIEQVKDVHVLENIQNKIWVRDDGYVSTTNKEHLDRKVISHFLTNESYWAKGMNVDLVEKLIDNSSVCFGIYTDHANQSDIKQIGFGRVVSDFVRFSYLADVFILTEYRGKDLGKWLIETIVNIPTIRGTKFMLATKDVHELYTKYGFNPLKSPENIMERPINWEIVDNDHLG
jgi:GNAT superfamily N-acetyltransferase